MPEETETPKEIVDKQLTDLEKAAEYQKEKLDLRMQGTFWDKVKLFFREATRESVDRFTDFSPISARAIFDVFIGESQEAHNQDAIDKIKAIFDKETDPAIVLKRLQEGAKVVPGAGLLFFVAQWSITAAGLLTAFASGPMELARQQSFNKVRPTILPIEYALDVLFKDPTKLEQVKDVLDRSGLSDSFQDLMKISAVAPLGVGEARSAWLREEISESEHDAILKANHLSDESVTTLKKLYKIIPPVNDIILMAVREVFSPEIVQRFGQLEGLPGEFVSWAKKQGLSEFWAGNYWAAHWNLPSVLQGFEMLHRRVIEQPDLELLMRALDIMPFWRDKLIDISYRPLTRVDVRRMFGLGVLNEQGVFEAYLDHGYSESNAKRMTEFTIKFVMDKEKDLSKTDIINLFKKYALTRPDASNMLISIGYSEVEADLLLTKAEFEMYQKYKNDQIKYIEKAYVAGKISESEANTKLGKLDLPAAEQNYLMTTWELAKDSKVKVLTLENLKAFFAGEIITEAELKSELTELGYNTVDRDRFVTLFKKAGAE